MAILDRFRAVPASKHSDPDVRLAYVEALSIDEHDQLVAAARGDESARVRGAAVGKLMDPSVLALVVGDDPDPGVRASAMSMLRDIALEAFEDTGEPESLAAIDVLTDAKILSQVIKTTTRESVARHALARLHDPRALGSVARHAALESIRRAAFEALREHDEIVAVAMNSEFKDTSVAAVDRLDTRADLEHVATRSSNKSAMKRARARLRELDERTAAEAGAAAHPVPGPAAQPAGVDRVQIDRLQIVQRLEALAPADITTDDIQALQAALQESDARWRSLGVPGDGADPELRFAAATANIEARLAAARALLADRERAQAEASRQRDERQAAERAAVLAEAAEHARKEDERRRVRLLELVAEVESAAADEDLRSATRRLGLAQREWDDMTGSRPADGGVTERYSAAHARVIARDTESREADRRERRDALNRLHQLLARIEPLASTSDLSAKAAERGLSHVRLTLTAIPPLPSRQDHDDVLRRLRAVQMALTPKLQELREIEGWQRWANVGIQEQLCEKMEALTSVEAPEELARRIRELQQQWRESADVPRAQGETLWRRFKAAHDEVWTRCEAHFAAEAGRRQENLAKKTALCERAEGLADRTSWVQTAEEIKRLQAEWKTVGPVSRGQEKAIWERFRIACDRFFTRRHEDLVQRKALWAENFAKKDALCVRAEALAESADWDAAAGELRRLQAEWKTIGPVKKSRSDAIWQRFRGACDRFFARFAQRHEIARGERVAAREAICVELEAASAVSTSGDPVPADLLASVRSLRARWQEELAMRGVDPDRGAALGRRFAAAFDRVIVRWPQVFGGTDLDPEANRLRMEALVRRVETLAASLGGPAASAGGDAALVPTTRLAAMLKEALAANTIGGKVDEDARWRAAQEDLRLAQASWSRIGTVPESARRALTDRFHRACRQIAEQRRS
jgi:hypothetical protein